MRTSTSSASRISASVERQSRCCRPRCRSCRGRRGSARVSQARLRTKTRAQTRLGTVGPGAGRAPGSPARGGTRRWPRGACSSGASRRQSTARHSPPAPRMQFTPPHARGRARPGWTRCPEQREREATLCVGGITEVAAPALARHPTQSTAHLEAQRAELRLARGERLLEEPERFLVQPEREVQHPEVRLPFAPARSRPGCAPRPMLRAQV